MKRYFDSHKTKTIIFIIFVFLSFMFLLGCSNFHKFKSSDFPGTYEINYKKNGKYLGTEQWVLKKDGNYQQILNFVNKHKVYNTGTWNIDKMSKGNRIVIHDAYDFVFFAGLNVPPKKIELYYPCDFPNGKTRIIVNDDEGYYMYKK